MENEFLTIAKIVKPQGIRGEVKVLAMTDSPEDLKEFDRVYVGGNCHKMLKVRPVGGECAVIALSGIADRNAAETLRNLDVLSRKADAPELPDGTYYIVDVIGCTVYRDDGEKIGSVATVTPARTDVYEVEREGGGTITFPAVEGLIESVDLDDKKIVVNGERLAQVALESK